MPRIRNFALPAALTEELVSHAKGFIPEVVADWGKLALPGGFTRVEMIRERMIARFRSDAPLDAITLDMLSYELPHRDTISALSLSAIQEAFVPCCVLAGIKPWLLSLLVDPRDEVHKWAVEIASKPLPEQEPTAGELEQAEGSIIEFVEDKLLWPFDIELTPPSPNELPPLPPMDALAAKALADANRETARLRERVDHLNSELQQQKQRHQAKLKEQSETAERERKNLAGQLHAAREHEQRLLKQKQALEAQVADLERKVEARIAEGVREQTNALVRKWLEEPLKVEQQLEAVGKETSGLLEWGAQLLEAQARQDRHSGNRLELQGKLQALVEMRERLATTLHNALKPLPDLRPLLEQVEAEIEKVQSLLAPAGQLSELGAKLLSHINASSSWDEQRNTSVLLEQLGENKLLKSEELRSLYGAIHRKFSLLAETQKQRPAEIDTGWSLREVLYRNKPALLLLDGHNLLFNLPDIFAPYFEDGHPGRNARQYLVGVTSRLVGTRPNVLTKICFDGAKAAEAKYGPNVEVVYSGGTGANRADEIIVSHLQFKDLKSLDQKVFVVTDDREIRKAILQTGAKFVRNDLFAVFLRDFGCLS